MRLFKRKPVKYEAVPREYIPSAFLAPDVAEALTNFAYRQGAQAAYLVENYLLEKHFSPKRRWWQK